MFDETFFFQAEDGIRDLVRSRGLGDVYKRQEQRRLAHQHAGELDGKAEPRRSADAYGCHHGGQKRRHAEDEQDDGHESTVVPLSLIHI